jgi:hypothetical protein
MFDSDCDSGGGAGQENGERPSLGVTIRSSRPHTPALPSSVTAVEPLGLRKSHRTGLIRERLVSKLGSRASPVFYARMVKILNLSEHMGLRTAGRLQGISRIHPGYIGLRAVTPVVTFALGSHFRRRRANDCFAFFGHMRMRLRSTRSRESGFRRSSNQRAVTDYRG